MYVALQQIESCWHWPGTLKEMSNHICQMSFETHVDDSMFVTSFFPKQSSRVLRNVLKEVKHHLARSHNGAMGRCPMISDDLGQHDKGARSGRWFGT